MNNNNTLLNLGDGVYHALLQGTAEAIVLIDETKNVLLWNHAAEKLWGYTAEETLGKNINNYVPPASKSIARWLY